MRFLKASHQILVTSVWGAVVRQIKQFNQTSIKHQCAIKRGPTIFEYI